MAAITFSQEESDEFFQAAIEELVADRENFKFSGNVAKVAEWAVQVDESFTQILYGLKQLDDKHGTDFPALGPYFNEWHGYKKQLDAHLHLSRDVASRHALDLRKFDQVVLSVMEDIQDEQDRKDLITELGDMAKEDHTESENMIQRFKALKTDIGHFLVRFDEWFQGTGTELKQEAYDLGQGINNLTEKIEQLDEEIALTTPALLAGAAAAGPMIVLIQLIVPGTTLGSSMTLRLEQASQLSGIQRELADVNRNQQELAQIKTEFDGLKPDIALICPKLALIGEIWPAIRGQALHFRQTLMGGKEAHKNLRFKQEVQLARNLCRVVGFGLDRYAMELERRK